MSECEPETSLEQVGWASLPAYVEPLPLEPVFTRYRRNPHWRLTGANYFLTWRLHASQHELNSTEREVVQDAIRHFDDVRYHLWAWVVMNDHVHVLLKVYEESRLEEILHSWKSFTSHQLQRHHGRAGRVWIEESFDRIVRDEHEFLQKRSYIAANPSRRWPETQQYPWLGLRDIE